MKFLCPISGLPVFAQDNWRERTLGENFKANFYTVGQSVLYSGPSGAADLQSVKAVLQMSAEVAQKVAGGTGAYVQIEDYAALNKATIEARRHFIGQMTPRDRLMAVIFCNLSPMLQLFVKIGARFNTTRKRIYVAHNYREAILMALRLCEEQNLDPGPFVFGKQVSYSHNGSILAPPELLSNSSWDIKAEGYTNRTLLIDRCILHSVSSGFLEENHVPLIDDMRSRVRENLFSHENLDYIVVDVSALNGGSRKARHLYVKSLKDWCKRFPFRAYIMYGANAFMRTALRLANPFMPFRIMLAKDIEHAFMLIQEDKHPKHKEKATLASDPIEKYQEELLTFIGGIDWEQEGFNVPFDAGDQSHPFLHVFQAIALIKNEVDDLFRSRREMQRELEKSEKKYRELFEKGSDFLCTHDLDGTLMDTNLAFKKGYGWHGALPSGTNIRDLIAEKHRPHFDDYLDRIKNKGRDEGTMAITTAAGREIVLEYNNVLVRNDSGKPLFVQGSARDITDRIEAERKNRKLQSQLQQAQKMEAIGNLAGGIAHEFNNVLSIIVGNAELAMDHVPGSNPAKEHLREICIASLRAREVVRQILSFARKTMTSMKPLEIKAIVNETVKLMRASIPTMIEIRVSMPAEPKMVLGDPTEIHQILINLCTNSAHSMKQKGGFLQVGLSDSKLDEITAAHYEDMVPGEYVKLSVEDTGEGIAPDVLEKVFEPYFTTKEFGAGSGMGLAVVHGLVKKCKGAIHITSTVGKGTIVEVLFPKIDREAPEESVTEHKLPMGKEKILLVDDDESIIRMVRQMLERLGYSVLDMTDSLAALERFRSNQDEFDLVISDMSMPRMAGDQLAAEMLRMKKDIPILLCTGYSDTMDEKKAKQLGIKGFVTKPLNRERLAKAVRGALDSQ